MANYKFELIFRLNADEDPSAYLDALFEAGCDDASVSTGAMGYIGLDFTREAETPEAAIISAISNTKTAIPHAKLERAEPYLLNLSELAFELGFSKQNMSKYACGKAVKVKTPFPKPYIQGKTSYWSYFHVAQWMRNEGIVDISNETIDSLFSVWCLNRAIEELEQPPREKEHFTEVLLRYG